MILKVVLHCDSAAFDENPFMEIARILSKVPEKIRKQLVEDAELDGPTESESKLLDLNGNTVGRLTLTSAEEDDPQSAAFRRGKFSVAYQLSSLGVRLSPGRESRMLVHISNAMKRDEDIEDAARHSLRYSNEIGEK